MTQPISIMPCLDMQNGRVVKGVHFVDIRDAGDPVECARAYCTAGADELALLDDVILNVMEVLHHDLGDDKYRPAPLLRQMVDAGYLGMKSGRGFYEYD